MSPLKTTRGEANEEAELVKIDHERPPPRRRFNDYISFPFFATAPARRAKYLND